MIQSTIKRGRKRKARESPAREKIEEGDFINKTIILKHYATAIYNTWFSLTGVNRRVLGERWSIQE